MSESSVQHDTIVLERVLDAPLPRAFAAWTNPEDWDDEYDVHELRVGGRKLQRFGPPGERVFREEGRYEDIVANQRVLYTYSIWKHDVRITVSLQTVEFAAQAAGTAMRLTEQLAILDGGDTASDRERGIGQWLDKFQAALTSHEGPQRAQAIRD